MLMKRNVKFIMRNRAEKNKQNRRKKGNENINQQSMDDFMKKNMVNRHVFISISLVSLTINY